MTASTAEVAADAPVGYGLLDADELSQRFNGKVKRKTILHLAKRGIIPFVRIGHRVLFSPTALDDYIANGGRGYASRGRVGRPRRGSKR